MQAIFIRVKDLGLSAIHDSYVLGASFNRLMLGYWGSQFGPRFSLLSSYTNGLVL